MDARQPAPSQAAGPSRRAASPGRGQILLELKNVRKIREKGGVTFELRVPRLEIRAGEFLAVVGPSGCGKSTLLDFLGLVLKPTDYELYSFFSTAGGIDLGSLSENRAADLRRSELGYVLQSGGLLPYLSIADNILLPARLNRLGGDFAARRLKKLAERLGIADQLSKKPGHLSGGQRQRAAIARALIHNPKLVLADEPTAAVDYPTAREISGLFRDLTSRSGRGLVVVTHDLELVRPLADRFVSFKMQRLNARHTVSTLTEVSADG
ncbi:MAG: ABC transporter ATP-binding protein [Candidatus Adiutrix sp.]|nr:ABC transporter ATP-binding protein [Candidatus Adiutrix sp.]